MRANYLKLFVLANEKELITIMTGKRNDYELLLSGELDNQRYTTDNRRSQCDQHSKNTHRPCNVF